MLTIVAVGLILLGTALGAYLSYNFESDVEKRQKRITELNEEIEKVVNNSKKLNEEVLQITSVTKKLTEDVQTITNNIQNAQVELSDITNSTKELADKNIELTAQVHEVTEKTKELVDQNILVADQSNKLVQQLTNFQTGGNGYIKMELTYDGRANIYLSAHLISQYPLRNVLIGINDNGLNKEKGADLINEFIKDPSKLTDSRKRSYFQVKYDLINNNMNSLPQFHPLVRLNTEDYGKDLDFTILVEADNGHTVQHLEWKNFRDSKEQKSMVQRWAGPGRRGLFTIDTLPIIFK